MNKFANNEEMKYAHSILLNGKPYFDAKKIEIIECNESKDIKACPGSGKTTTLLAKLIIIANRMPLPNNQGICVLTHTNVAIDEIKSKLGHRASILFTYPNFFGTIQSFVDKFIANMAMQYYYESSINIIDDNVANKILINDFCRLDQYSNPLHKMLFGRFVNDMQIISEDDIVQVGSKEDLLRLKVISSITKGKSTKYKFNFSGYRHTELTSGGLTYITINKIYRYKEKVQDRMLHAKKDFISNCHIDFVSRKVFSSGTPLNLDTPSGTELLQLKENIFKAGILKYHEAYDIAMRLCSEHGDIIKNAISSRFKYLFIDEMQDTDINQFNLINNVFCSVVTQCFGDHHQAIYNKVEKDSIWTPNNYLSIDNSMRFGENIARILQSVCMEDNRDLQANVDIKSLKSILIIYDNPTEVLPKFIEILETHKIDNETIYEIAKKERESDPLKRNNIKAIGWVGREKDCITIKSYFPSFNKDVRKIDKVNYESLKSFLKKKASVSTKIYADCIINAILHILSLSKTSKNEVNGRLRNHTKTSFFEKYSDHSIDEFNQFRTKLVGWAKAIHICNDSYCDQTFNEIKIFIRVDLSVIFNFDPTSDIISSFIENTEEAFTDDEVNNNNIYVYNNIEVDINTIHYVKGETHVATLYLETSYHKKCESQRISNQLKGVAYTENAPYHIETLKMAYVGMSRPRYLLCMAIHKDNFNFRCDNLDELWDIVVI